MVIYEVVAKQFYCECDNCDYDSEEQTYHESWLYSDFNNAFIKARQVFGKDEDWNPTLSGMDHWTWLRYDGHFKFMVVVLRRKVEDVS